MSDEEERIEEAVRESVAAADEAASLIRESAHETQALADLTNAQAAILEAALSRSGPDRKRAQLSVDAALRKARRAYVEKSSDRRRRIRTALDRNQEFALVWVRLAGRASDELRREIVRYDSILERHIRLVEDDGLPTLRRLKEGMRDEPASAGSRELIADIDEDTEEALRQVVALKFIRITIGLALDA